MDLSNANANAINPRRGLDLPLSVLSPLAYLPYGCQRAPFRLASHSPHSSRLNRVWRGLCGGCRELVSNVLRKTEAKKGKQKGAPKAPFVARRPRDETANPWRTGRLNECGEEDTAPCCLVCPLDLPSRVGGGRWRSSDAGRGVSHTQKKSLGTPSSPELREILAMVTK